MDSLAPLTPLELFNHVVGDMAEAVCQRPGESAQQRAKRLQVATGTVMAFSPRDLIETVLAGRCVMFHELVVDSIHHTLRGELDTTRRATRATIVAMDKAFGNNLARFERYRTRSAEPAPAELPAAETNIADRIQRHQSVSQPQAAPEAPSPELPPVRQSNEQPSLPLQLAEPTPFRGSPGATQPAEPHRLVPIPGLTSLPAGNAQPPAYAPNRQQRRHPNR